MCNWFKCNKLSLNASKTNLMFIGTPHQIKQVNDSRHIHLDGCKLTRVTEAKFLGITLDSNLTWIPSINSISKKCSKNLGVLNKIKHFLPERHMYQLYCSLIMPYLNYDILLWESANKEHIRKIQKRALRITSNSPYLSHTQPLFERYNALDINNMYTKELCLFIYNYHNGLL